MTTVRKATLDNNEDFAKLILISAPFLPILFGDKIKLALQDLFRYQSNLFSFKHVNFVEVDVEKAGMTLGYDWRIKKRGWTQKLWGRVCDGEYYISNIATYPRYRGKGVGMGLILEAEQEAKLFSAKKIVLDVEKENISAINFYRKLG